MCIQHANVYIIKLSDLNAQENTCKCIPVLIYPETKHHFLDQVNCSIYQQCPVYANKIQFTIYHTVAECDNVTYILAQQHLAGLNLVKA